jgi:hypothetical protein
LNGVKLIIVYHRRERKARREKTFFVVKEKDYFTAPVRSSGPTGQAENAKDAEVFFAIKALLGNLSANSGHS